MTVSFPADGFGNIIPLLAVSYGNSIPEQAITTAGITAGAQTVSDGTGSIIRIWVFGCDIYYKTGITGLTAATSADALLLSGQSVDVPVPSGHTLLRAIAKTGSGMIRIEKLG
jgi:hypothetical protein